MNIEDWTIRIHGLAKSKGWWDCQACNAEGCDGCSSTGHYRDIGESFALIHSEASEALEALRKPELDGVCDKCAGDWPCEKCGSTGQALGGSRYHEEVADVAIRVLDFAGFFGVNITASMSTAELQLAHELALDPPSCKAAELNFLHGLIVAASSASRFAYLDDFYGPKRYMAPALAKVVSFCMMLVGSAERLDEVVALKHEYNSGRAHRHGKAF